MILLNNYFYLNSFLGFNLHAEKGKPGQYVGKVDTDSPAEQAGLREGDRILEVNGVDIGSETHKQVVERIKAIPNETTLLVLDPSPIVQQHHNRTNGTSAKNKMSPVNNNHHINDTNGNGVSSSSPTMNESRTKAASNGGSPSLSLNNNESDKKMIMTTTTTTTTTGTNGQHNGGSNGVYDQHNNSNGNVNKSPVTTKAAQGQLKLNMTAAEMRAMLQAKKKYDPKNESIDLRKKHDIIDKL